MLNSVAKTVIALCLLTFIASPSYGDFGTVKTADKLGQETSVVVITDPDIEAVEEEEPDCE